MKHLFHIAIMVVLVGCMGSFTSCMQNNGYIGNLFGQWRLEEVVVEQAVQECDTIFFSFQSDVFQVRRIIYDSYDYTTFTGLYERSEEKIKFNFYNYNGNDVVTADDTLSMLLDLQSLYINETSPTFNIKRLDRNEMTLQYNNYEYYFKKLN